MKNLSDEDIASYKKLFDIPQDQELSDFDVELSRAYVGGQFDEREVYIAFTNIELAHTKNIIEINVNKRK